MLLNPNSENSNISITSLARNLVGARRLTSHGGAYDTFMNRDRGMPNPICGKSNARLEPTYNINDRLRHMGRRRPTYPRRPIWSHCKPKSYLWEIGCKNYGKFTYRRREAMT